MYIAKVRQDEDGPWQYVDEANCAVEKQCHARRFRDRKIAKDVALEYDCDYKIVRLVPRGWKGGQVVILPEDEAAAYSFSGEDGIELNEYDLVILSAHFARFRLAITARLEEMETYYDLLKASAKERIARHLAKAAREDIKRKKALTEAQRSISKWKNRAAARKVALSCIADAIDDVKTARAKVMEGPRFRVVYTYANGTTYTTQAAWRTEKAAEDVGETAFAMSAKDNDPTYRIVDFFTIESAAEPGWVRPDPAAGVIAWERNKDLTGGAR